MDFKDDISVRPYFVTNDDDINFEPHILGKGLQELVDEEKIEVIPFSAKKDDKVGVSSVMLRHRRGSCYILHSCDKIGQETIDLCVPEPYGFVVSTEVCAMVLGRKFTGISNHLN